MNRNTVAQLKARLLDWSNPNHEYMLMTGPYRIHLNGKVIGTFDSVKTAQIWFDGFTACLTEFKNA